MEIKDIKKMTAEDLNIELNKAQQEVMKISFAIQSGSEKNVAKLHEVKQRIAKIQTVLTEINNK